MDRAKEPTGENGAIVAAVVLIFIVVIGLVWHPANEALCPQTEAMQKVTPGLNCFEFWLYRYQTLVAGVGAIVAAIGGAWLAWKATHRQITTTLDLARRHEEEALDLAFEYALRLKNRLEVHLDDLLRIEKEIPTWEGLDAAIALALDNGMGTADGNLEGLIKFCGPKAGARIFAMSIVPREVGVRYQRFRPQIARAIEQASRGLPTRKPPFALVTSWAKADVRSLAEEIATLRRR